MSNLLKLEIKGLFRQFVFRVLILLCPVLGAGMGVMNHAMSNTPADGLVEWCAILCVMLSALGGLYISREFTRNTIRNKIVVGHSRWHIYLSKLAAVAVLYLVCVGLFVASITLTEWILLRKITLQGEMLVRLVLTILACVALTTAISMTVRTDLGGLVPLLVLYLSMIFSGLGYELIDKEIMDGINLFLPCGTLMMPQSPKLLLCVGCAVAEAVLLCAGGYLALRKADLN